MRFEPPQSAAAGAAGVRDALPARIGLRRVLFSAGTGIRCAGPGWAEAGRHDMMKARASFILTAVLLLVPQILAQKLPWHPNQEELTGVTRVLLVPPDVRVEKWTTTTGQEIEGTAEFVRR